MSDSSNVLVRKALQSDIEAVAKVYLESNLAAYRELASQEYLSEFNLSHSVKQWAYNISEGSGTVVVAECDRDITGLASFDSARDDDVDASVTGELQAIYVAPSVWHRGIGSRLCMHSMNRLYRDGKTAIVLWVLAGNVSAIDFYKRAGFTPDGKSKTVRMGKDLEAIRLNHSSSRESVNLAT